MYAVTTLVGAGGPGLSVGTLANTRLTEPNGVAVDDEGKVYIADATRVIVLDLARGVSLMVAGGTEVGWRDGPVDSGTPACVAVCVRV